MHAPHDPDLTRLRTKWSGRWKIWRARRDAGRVGDFVASRLDDSSGPWPTVMAGTAADLDAKLADQAERAERGERQPQP